MMKQALRIDIVSDVVCPWCIIGYKQVERALTLLPEPV
jgi:predicted DsbA family dithiol-disulfide isomerase